MRRPRASEYVVLTNAMQVDKEISEMKLFVGGLLDVRFGDAFAANISLKLNARARFVAESFLTPVSVTRADPPTEGRLLTLLA